MLPNRISATLTREEQKQILDSIKAVEQQLQFLKDLTKAEIRRMPKMGSRSKPFVEKGLEVAMLHPELLPGYFDTNEMQKDLALYNTLLPIQISVSRLASRLNDTMILLGSEAFSAALLVYNQLQVAPNSAGLGDILREMSQRFAQANKDDGSDETDPDPNKP